MIVEQLITQSLGNPLLTGQSPKDLFKCEKAILPSNFFLYSCEKHAYYMPEIHVNEHIYVLDALMAYISGYKIKFLS